MPPYRRPFEVYFRAGQQLLDEDGRVLAVMARDITTENGFGKRFGTDLFSECFADMSETCARLRVTAALLRPINEANRRELRRLGHI